MGGWIATDDSKYVKDFFAFFLSSGCFKGRYGNEKSGGSERWQWWGSVAIGGYLPFEHAVFV
jgi:hypothetical protein